MPSDRMMLRCVKVGWRSSVWTTGGLLLLAGCASQGPLRPPSLHLPGMAESLVAQRVGDRAELAWTTPATTTDGEKIKGAITANVCLEEHPSGVVTASSGAARPAKRGKKTVVAPPAGPVTACQVVQHLTVTAGPAKATVELGPALTTGASKLVAYRVELLNANGRSAGASMPVYVAAGSAPAALAALTISARRSNAVIEWKADATPAVVELRRTLVATAAGPVTDVPRVKQAKTAALPFSPATTKEPAREVVLRPDEPAAKDAGGMVDAGVRDGDTYLYVAQRVRTVTLSGQRFELRSAPSAAVKFTYRDVFPPKAPTGLVLVPGGGFGESPTIDLSWDANFESDLAGYDVYRSEGAEFVKLNEDAIATPAFRDVHVVPGHTYSYRVTAIDRRKNESAASAAVRETLRK